MTQKASVGVLTTLQSEVTTGNGTVVAPPPNARNHSVIIKGSADVSAGKVKVECASAPDYAGDWALIGSEVTVGDDTEQIVTFVGIYPFVRARVSTDVTGGTVSAYYIGA